MLLHFIFYDSGFKTRRSLRRNWRQQLTHFSLCGKSKSSLYTSCPTMGHAFSLKQEKQDEILWVLQKTLARLFSANAETLPLQWYILKLTVTDDWRKSKDVFFTCDWYNATSNKLSWPSLDCKPISQISFAFQFLVMQTEQKIRIENTNWTTIKEFPYFIMLI